MKFAALVSEYQLAESSFEMSLDDAGLEFDRIWFDHYDNSMEVDKVPSEFRLNEAQQRLIFDAGFSCMWLNHTDGWETYYYWAGWKEGQFSLSAEHRTLKAVPVVQALSDSSQRTF